MQATATPTLDETLRLALSAFPNSYWTDVYAKRKEQGVSREIKPLEIFSDVIQFAGGRNKEDRKYLNVLPFCTVPRTPDHWDCVMALYVLADPKSYPHSSLVARALIPFFNPAEEEGKFMHPNNVENFDNETLAFLRRCCDGLRSNGFFGDPAACTANMLADLEKLTGEKDYTGYFDESSKQIAEVLNAEPRAEQFQAELDQLSDRELLEEQYEDLKRQGR